MTPIMVLISMIFGIMVTYSRGKKIKRNSEIIMEEDAKGLKEVFNYLDDKRKICRYFFSNSLKEKLICENEFECNNCFIHQKLKEIDVSENYTKKIEKIGGMEFNLCYFYHRGHTWLNIEKNGYVKIGFDPFLKNVFKKSEKVILSKKGDFLEIDEIGCALQIEETICPILSPISGEIVRVNRAIFTELKSNSQKYPWLYIVKPFHLSVDLQELLYGREALNWFRYEVENFLKELSDEKEFVADGGTVDFSNLKVNFEKFRESFLLSLKNKNGGIS